VVPHFVPHALDAVLCAGDALGELSHALTAMGEISQKKIEQRAIVMPTDIINAS
jgi:dethiobiotin synthetase